MIGIAAVSFASSLLIFLGYSQWSFYAPIPRAWELLVGGLAAHQFLDRPRLAQASSGRLINLAAIAGVALIGGAALFYDRTIPFPGLYALLPTAGALLIIMSARSSVNRTILSSRLMVWFGLISYPLYLWHWPLLSYLATVQNGLPTNLEILLTVALSILLAWLTFALWSFRSAARRAWFQSWSRASACSGSLVSSPRSHRASSFGFRRKFARSLGSLRATIQVFSTSVSLMRRIGRLA